MTGTGTGCVLESSSVLSHLTAIVCSESTPCNLADGRRTSWCRAAGVAGHAAAHPVHDVLAAAGAHL